MRRQIQTVVVRLCAGFIAVLVLPLKEMVGVINEAKRRHEQGFYKWI
jgi:hypothetical protein